LQTAGHSQDKIESAHADYQQLKDQKDNQDKWIGQLISAQAQAKNMMKQCLWKQLQQREQATKKAHQVKQALRKTGFNSRLLQVEAPRSSEFSPMHYGIV